MGLWLAPAEKPLISVEKDELSSTKEKDGSKVSDAAGVFGFLSFLPTARGGTGLNRGSSEVAVKENADVSEEFDGADKEKGAKASDVGFDTRGLEKENASDGVPEKENEKGAEALVVVVEEVATSEAGVDTKTNGDCVELIPEEEDSKANEFVEVVVVEELEVKSGGPDPEDPKERAPAGNFPKVDSDVENDEESNANKLVAVLGVGTNAKGDMEPSEGEAEIELVVEEKRGRVNPRVSAETEAVLGIVSFRAYPNGQKLWPCSKKKEIFGCRSSGKELPGMSTVDGGLTRTAPDAAGSFNSACCELNQ